ncbi:hypothetical protein L209DRAFT_534227 [Thermothelomyces heterothallicus CBS 203.75]
MDAEGHERAKPTGRIAKARHRTDCCLVLTTRHRVETPEDCVCWTVTKKVTRHLRISHISKPHCAVEVIVRSSPSSPLHLAQARVRSMIRTLTECSAISVCADGARRPERPRTAFYPKLRLLSRERHLRQKRCDKDSKELLVHNAPFKWQLSRQKVIDFRLVLVTVIIMIWTKPQGQGLVELAH